MKALPAAGLLLPCAVAVAFEQGDLHGLQVRVDAMHEPLAVDGVPMRIRRAEGAQVAELAVRVAHRWHAAGSPVTRFQSGDWAAASRLDGSRTELIQWRGHGGTGELLYSRIDMTQGIARPATPPFRLPPACRWGRSVQGGVAHEDYSQHSALCRGNADVLLGALRQAALDQGWQVQPGSPHALHLSRRGISGIAVLSAGSQRGEIWLVWIGSGREVPAP